MKMINWILIGAIIFLILVGMNIIWARQINENITVLNNLDCKRLEREYYCVGKFFCKNIDAKFGFTSLEKADVLKRMIELKCLGEEEVL